ncbi:MAG: Wadjet anti-phage system protein JetD domain-containing protein [Acidithiobacillus sp.]|uniref:Wadjet anti-phage system protein JetD domain-containing protein n=1 Tax=Acidithiobacillus sp. TaxID=1872118 RepID=UPI003D02C856
MKTPSAMVANLAHRGVLSELLDLALAANAIDPAASGAGQFARRYGFRDKPLRVRFRLLDPRRRLLPTASDQDLTVTHDTFAQLDPNVARVFITENEINFLAFPKLADSLVLFGAGYGFDMLAHRPQWGKEPQPVLRDLTRLGPRERALFADLRDQPLGQKIRLEQERIGFSWVERAPVEFQQGGPQVPALPTSVPGS